MTKSLELVRFAHAPGYGVFGRLRIWGGPFACYTVERPWDGNARDRSCIPAGYYPLSPSYFNRGGYEAYQVLSVPGRSRIKLHRGNRPSDVSGCIALGLELGAVEGRWAVLRSREAFEAFMREMAGQEGHISIRSEDLDFGEGG